MTDQWKPPKGAKLTAQLDALLYVTRDGQLGARITTDQGVTEVFGEGSAVAMLVTRLTVELIRRLAFRRLDDDSALKRFVVRGLGADAND